MTDHATTFINAVREVKAAARAFTGLPTDDLFQLILEAVRRHDKAKAAFLASLEPSNPGTPRTPTTATTGVSRTHCIK